MTIVYLNCSSALREPLPVLFEFDLIPHTGWMLEIKLGRRKVPNNN